VAEVVALAQAVLEARGSAGVPMVSPIFRRRRESGNSRASSLRFRPEPKAKASGGPWWNVRLSNRVFGRIEESLATSERMKMEHSPSANIAPNFFIIGAPKSGTTSLCEYLNGHPNIYFSPVKEPHFFDVDMSKRLRLGLQMYLSLFCKADPALHKAVGEGSTGYLISKVAVSEILKFNVDAKFIVMLRNPVELVQAWHAQMNYEGVENIGDFESAWKLEPERKRGRNIPRNCLEPKQLYYSDWGMLGEQMERLFAVAPRNRVKIVLFDDYVADLKGIYEEVLSFLGVPTDGRNVFPIVNENKVVLFPRLQRLTAYTANHIRRVRIASGLKLGLGVGLFPKMLAFNSKPSPRKPISPALRAELADCFRADIGKLSKLLGRDLSHWV